MTTAIKNLVQDFNTSWSSNFLKKLMSYFEEKGKYKDYAGEFIKEGKKEIKDFYNDLYKGCSDIKFEIWRGMR